MTGMIICLLVLTVTADLMTDSIPNALTLTGLMAGLWNAYMRAGPSELFSSAEAAVLMFFTGYLLFRLRALRGGDGKLLTALASMLGIRLGMKLLLFSLILAVLLGIPGLIRRHLKERTGIHYSVPVMIATLLLL
ncbi:MAG: prepilin peptidase [Lachnospiraceae bacterium]|nr:prepilin peptidase [Lachnospiraceae bacterium]